MYKLNKNISAKHSFKQAEALKKFSPDVPLMERLKQAWFLSAMAFGIDPTNPPLMEKRLVSIRKKQSNG